MNEEIIALTQRIALLEAENSQLREKVAFFENHPAIAAGIQGESLVSKLISGTVTEFNAPHDIETQTGLQIEVKYSKLNLANRKQTNTTKRWSWKNVFGASGKKQYDRLILIGESDKRHAGFYLEPNSPYVIFDVGYQDIMQLTSATEHRQRLIQLTTNPQSVRSKASRLFRHHQVSSVYLATKYGL